jgi:hypothetical protein
MMPLAIFGARGMGDCTMGIARRRVPARRRVEEKRELAEAMPSIDRQLAPSKSPVTATRVPSSPSAEHPRGASDVLHMQRLVGNRQVSRHVEGSSGGHRIQRDVLSHVEVDDPNFWGTLKGQIKSDYGLWLGQVDRTFRGFVSIMQKDTGYSPHAWISTVQAWAGVAGQPGDIASALLETSMLAAKSLEEVKGKRVSLGDLEKLVISDLNALTDRVRHTDSELPIYKVVDKKQQQEQGGTPKGETRGQQDFNAFRLGVRNDLAKTLGQLPGPDRIMQDLTTKWIVGQGAQTTSPPAIIYDVVFDMRGSSPEEVKPNSSTVVAGRNLHEKPALVDIEKPTNTIEALKAGFGEGYPLHKLPVTFYVAFTVLDPVPHSSSRYARYVNMVGTWGKEGNTWAPVKGLGSDRLDEVGSLWFKSGKKPTLADLLPFPGGHAKDFVR